MKKKKINNVQKNKKYFIPVFFDDSDNYDNDNLKPMTSEELKKLEEEIEDITRKIKDN